MMFVTNGKGVSITLEDETINIVQMQKNRSLRLDVKVSSVINVNWKEPGRLNGFIRFVVPGGKNSNEIPLVSMPRDGCVFFGRNRRDEFRLLYDAVVDSINSARRFSVHLNTAIKPGFILPITTPETPAIEVRRDLRLGEIRREFDSQTVGAIQGTMCHELGLHGGFMGISLGRIGFVSGQLGVSGTSGVNLQAHSTTRTDFLNNSFIAIFDEPTQTPIPETLRVIVPSESACRELILDYVNSIFVQMGLDRFNRGQVQMITESFSRIFTTDISYVSDRLAAALRITAEQTPAFNVVGIMSGPHMMLGGAIQMPGEEKWLQLFPVGLLRFLSILSSDGETPEQLMMPS